MIVTNGGRCPHLASYDNNEKQMVRLSDDN